MDVLKGGGGLLGREGPQAKNSVAPTYLGVDRLHVMHVHSVFILWLLLAASDPPTQSRPAVTVTALSPRIRSCHWAPFC